MRPITRSIIEEYTQRIADIEPIEFVNYIKDILIKKNSNLLGLMEYLRLKFPLNEESFSAMCTIIRYAMMKQRDANEIGYMSHQEAPGEIIVSDDVLHYIYTQIEENYTQFIPERIREISENDDEEFMKFVLKVSKIEMDYISRMVTDYVPSFETRIIGYIPMLCVYDMYKDFLEEDFRIFMEKMKE